jgi:hypothetical protein
MVEIKFIIDLTPAVSSRVFRILIQTRHFVLKCPVINAPDNDLSGKKSTTYAIIKLLYVHKYPGNQMIIDINALT